MECPHCQSSESVKHGVLPNGRQRYRCRACNRAYTDNGALPGRRVPPEIVGAALSSFFEGMSYRDIRRHIQSLHGISLEPSTIYRWVLEYTDRGHKIIEGVKAFTGGSKWVVDETMIKVVGGNIWVWNVMDARSRFILATHLSKHRNAHEASIVMRKAKDKAATLPKWIKTDKLPSYGVAINQVFGGDMVGHMRSEGITGTVNNMSERLQGAFRARTKVMRGLQSQESGQRFLDGWVIDYNFFRPHMSLNGKTPADAAGLDVPIHSWAEVAALPANGGSAHGGSFGATS